MPQRRQRCAELVHAFATRTAKAKTTVSVFGSPGDAIAISIVGTTPSDGAQDDTVALDDNGALDANGEVHVDYEDLAPGAALEVHIGETAILLTVPSVPFDSERFLSSSGAVSYDRFGFGGLLDFTGQFLALGASRCTCPHARVMIYNRGSDERFLVEADDDGSVFLELSDTYPGDLLDVSVEDVDDNPTPNGKFGYVVPAMPVLTSTMQDALASGDAARVLVELSHSASASNRHFVEKYSASLSSSDEDIAKRKQIADAVAELFSGANQVKLHCDARPVSSTSH